MMTREERRARNKMAHAIRRDLANQDYRAAKLDGGSIAWRDIAATYDAMSVDDILATFGTPAPVPTDAAVPAPTKRRRSAPAHVARARDAYRLARESWETGLAGAVAGGRTLADGGRPARGERYPDEERAYRDAHPAPVYRDFLADEYAAMGRA